MARASLYASTAEASAWATHRAALRPASTVGSFGPMRRTSSSSSAPDLAVAGEAQLTAVVAAGMDGALPSVVAGLIAAPVMALPTSVGYGAFFPGLAALLAMLNACAPGVGVVNIDNGYGAGHLAAQIAAPAEERSRA